MKATETRLYFFEEKRLIRLFRQVALSQIRREYYRASDSLEEIEAILSNPQRESWAPGLSFVQEWRKAVLREQRGESLETAPAAWVHLGQELAALIESRGDWIGYLSSRWRLDQADLALSRRFALGLLAFFALTLSGLIFFLFARGLWQGSVVFLAEPGAERGFMGFLLLLGRLAGTVLMAEQGFTWARRALTGKSSRFTVRFLADGLVLLP